MAGGIELLDHRGESSARAALGGATGERDQETGSGCRHRPGGRRPALARDGPAATTLAELVEAEPDPESLREYLLDGVGTSRPRPQDGTEVRVRLEPGDVDRARELLSELARRPGVYDPIALAATSLDVALQDLRVFVGEYARPVTVALDRWDCTLVVFAALETTCAPGECSIRCPDPSGRSDDSFGD